ncbi:enoyl-CoA hydratase/isomerase family protein [Advenella kashmirensis]
MPDYSKYKSLKIEKQGNLAVVTLNRPDERNVIDQDLHDEIETIWTDISNDHDVNAVLLTGAGKYFSVGGNIKAMQDSKPGADVVREGEMLQPTTGRRILQALLDCDKPIICAINGDCIGLAATVALFCDITVASETARIADPHVKVGLVAGDGGAVIWPMLVGPNRAKEFLMRGCLLTGKEAERIGLVNYACPLDEVYGKAEVLARELADNAPWAVRWTKLSVNKWIKQQLNLIMDTSFSLEMATFHTEDHKEAVQAFVERRKPVFKGR